MSPAGWRPGLGASLLSPRHGRTTSREPAGVLALHRALESLPRRGPGSATSRPASLHTGWPWGKRTTGNPRGSGPERRPGESPFVTPGPHLPSGDRLMSSCQNHRTPANKSLWPLRFCFPKQRQFPPVQGRPQLLPPPGPRPAAAPAPGSEGRQQPGPGRGEQGDMRGLSPRHQGPPGSGNEFLTSRRDAVCVLSDVRGVCTRALPSVAMGSGMPFTQHSPHVQLHVFLATQLSL